MRMKSVLITGARKGLGLELAKQYAEDGWQVFACCREPLEAGDLAILSHQFEALSIHRLDVCNPHDLTELANTLSRQAIDVLINNAGVYGEGGQQFGASDTQEWLKVFEVNSIAPMKVMEAFTDNVKRSDAKRMINISSKMGSMDDNGSGGSYLYRSSKAALNAVVKSAGIDLKETGVTVVAVHPGWVRTDMGGPNGELSITDGVSALRQVVARIDIKDSGTFIDIDGSRLAW